MKKIRLLITFYLSFALVTLLFTAAGGITLYKAGSFTAAPAKLLPGIIWIKVISSAIVICYINNYQQKQFFYFQNLRLSKLFLWSYTIGFDLLLFIAVLMAILI
jgi:hypothetical protein